jgi:hypothetical protein
MTLSFGTKAAPLRHDSMLPVIGNVADDLAASVLRRAHSE